MAKDMTESEEIANTMNSIRDDSYLIFAVIKRCVCDVSRAVW